MFSWNFTFAIIVKIFSYFFLSKRCLGKRIKSSATSLVIKLGKSDDEISSNMFTVISATVPLI